MHLGPTLGRRQVKRWSLMDMFWTGTEMGPWQGRQLQKELESLGHERDELQEGLRRSNEECFKQVGCPPSPGLCACALGPASPPTSPPTDAGAPGPGAEL